MNRQQNDFRKKQTYIAHVRTSDGSIQTLEQHLEEVSSLSGVFAKKIGLEEAGKLIGLLHDFGKYSNEFQKYIRANTRDDLAFKDVDFDIDDISYYTNLRGRIDHSTAGAQWIKAHFSDKVLMKDLLIQLMSLSIVSHHSGLIDCIDADGENKYDIRLEKDFGLTHFHDCCSAMSDSISKAAKELINSEKLSEEIYSLVTNILSSNQLNNKVKEFYMGLLARFLFSCLVDADRISSADYEENRNICDRFNKDFSWELPVKIFEAHIKGYGNKSQINEIRKKISDQCLNRSSDDRGIYTLTVPTGGGKTFSSFRYALHHAKKHNLDRIIYVIPYTSIIEQNANEIRKIFTEVSDEYSQWVLEHHSNLEPEYQNWRSKMFAENWDAPIIFTTMVQFLEACFGGGTRGVRRLHQLANSVLIFDEIQTLPIKCVHMFCNLLNFLYLYANTTAILCTATQPVLDKLVNSERGELILSSDHEIFGLSKDVESLFDNLKRVDLVDKRKVNGWSLEDLTDFIIEKFNSTLSCLVVVNNKQWAFNLFNSCSSRINDTDSIFHLSTNQCSAHRKEIFKTIRGRLNANQPVLCISTQLIEAGVDISFKNVVRFIAGLDSIAQAAGRCNRHAEMLNDEGLPQNGTVYIVNPDREPIERLKDIVEGQKATLRLLSENPVERLFSPDCIIKYFKYYFFERTSAMSYPLPDGRNLLNLLSDNEGNNYSLNNTRKREIFQSDNYFVMMQSFSEAGTLFSAIDAPTKAVIVPFNTEAVGIIAELCCDIPLSKFKKLLQQSQKFSVSIFPYIWDQLIKKGAINEIRETGIFHLEKNFYDKCFGLSASGDAEQELLSC